MNGFDHLGHGIYLLMTLRTWHIILLLDTVQDFLNKLGMKSCIHTVEISIFSMNHAIVRPTKIMNKADKNWAHFSKIKCLKNQNFQKHFL